MPKIKSLEKISLGFLPRAVLAWAVSAAVMLVAGALLISKGGISSSGLGYLSSGISFVAALFSGAVAARGRNRGKLYLGLMSGAAMTVILLTLGFALKGAAIRADGVLSVASFTMAGSAAGAVLLSGGLPKSRKAPRYRRKS